MDLRRYVERIHQELVTAAEAGGEEALATAERLLAALESAVRLTLQDLLVAAVEEITRELAPGSVELRLRGRNPEFVVILPPTAYFTEEGAHGEDGTPQTGGPAYAAMTREEGDDATVARVNLRMPDHLKARVERAAAGEGLSVNTWLVRAAAATLDRAGPGRREERRAAVGGQHFTGWGR